MRRTLLAGIAVSALLLAGCSSNSESADKAAITSAATATSSHHPVTSTPAAAEAAPPSSGELPTGKALYTETCTASKDFFKGLEELSEMTGEPWDSKKAADEFIALIEHPENFPELQELAAESGKPTGNEEWDQLSKSDQEQIRKAVYAAAKGEC
ncbi:hypothetical protein [Rhodococcus sp. ACT016]|uniref:hypothetical protein n=1 Tax=Rhodococcus sp. ACT016 TaxID=3134808 RepID=UPI003D2D1BEB